MRLRHLVRGVSVGAWSAWSVGAARPGIAQVAASGVARAESLAVAGDSAAALALLDSIVRREPRNAAAWHRRGMIAWSMVRPRREAGFMRDQKDIALARLADTSLRRAVAHAPDSGRYATDMGRFLLNSKLTTTRYAAIGFLTKALTAARRTGDSASISRAADEVGMVHWRRYESVANRVLVRGSVTELQVAGREDEARDVEAYLESAAYKLPGFTGETDFLSATRLFDEALRADPSNPLALRHRFMALAERTQWEPLRAAAAERLAAAPWDAQAWLALGLATHRLQRSSEAAAAFDTGLTLLPEGERARYTRLSRVLRPKDTARVAGRTDAERRALEGFYWAMSDPLWLSPGNEHWLEFLSRVTFAELRWTSDDLDLRGADTDRGEIHVRYGPAPVVLGTPGSVVWRYPADGLTFVFTTPPTYGSGYFASQDYVDRMRQAAPVRWSNVPITRSLDSITVQVARFRATTDSMDVALVAEVPVARLVQGIDLARGALDVAFTHLDEQARVVMHDSARSAMDFGAVEPLQLRSWRRRMARTTAAYRVEAFQPDARRGARAVGLIAPVPDTGFAISDVLVGARMGARGDAVPERWRDVLITPTAGTLRQGQHLSVLWETYELVPRDGSHNYRVELSLRRTDGTRLGRFIARALAGTSGELEARSGRDRVALSFTRLVPARAVALDFVTLDFGTASPGRYRLTVAVTDLATGRRVARDRDLTIVE